MNKTLLISSFCLGLLASTQATYGHSRWLLPSHTSVSGEKTPIISIDSSISNDIFHPDLALGGKNIVPISKRLQYINNNMRFLLASPNGSEQEYTPTNFGRKSVVAVPLKQSGTYRAYIDFTPGKLTTYIDEKGEEHRFPGNREKAKAELPAGTEIIVWKINVNVATFITRNNTNQTTLATNSTGLEINWRTHPNDLFVGEATTLQLLQNGKPIANTEVTATRAGTRHRNDRNPLTSTTNDKGEFTFDWKEGGFYLIEASTESDDTNPNNDIDKAYSSLFVTVEVNPE